MNRWTGRTARAAGLSVALMCGGNAVADAARPNLLWLAGHTVAHETLEKSLYGDWASPVLVHASSPEEWDAAMAELERRGALMVTPAPPAPQVEWQRYSVCLVALGMQPSHEAEVQVREARRFGGRLVLDVEVKLGRPSHAAMTSPYHLVVVPRNGWRTVELLDASVVPATMETPQVAAAASVQAGPEGTDGSSEERMSWGRLKSRYR